MLRDPDPDSPQPTCQVHPCVAPLPQTQKQPGPQLGSEDPQPLVAEGPATFSPAQSEEGLLTHPQAPANSPEGLSLPPQPSWLSPHPCLRVLRGPPRSSGGCLRPRCASSVRPTHRLLESGGDHTPTPPLGPGTQKALSKCRQAQAWPAHPVQSAGPVLARVSGGVGGTSPRLGRGQSLHQRLRRGQARTAGHTALNSSPAHPTPNS